MWASRVPPAASDRVELSRVRPILDPLTVAWLIWTASILPAAEPADWVGQVLNLNERTRWVGFGWVSRRWFRRVGEQDIVIKWISGLAARIQEKPLDL